MNHTYGDFTAWGHVNSSSLFISFYFVGAGAKLKFLLQQSKNTSKQKSRTEKKQRGNVNQDTAAFGSERANLLEKTVNCLGKFNGKCLMTAGLEQNIASCLKQSAPLMPTLALMLSPIPCPPSGCANTHDPLCKVC